MDAAGAARIDEHAVAHSFCGVVRIDGDDGGPFERAYGLANRAAGLANTTGTRFGTASGSKGFTALAVLALVEDGVLAPTTTARELLGDDLPLIPPDVTVEHLLGHTSGIGDYIDEDAGGAIDDHVLPVPVHELDRTEAFVPVLDGYEPRFPAGAGFAYCNSGFVVLALLAERASGRTYHDLVTERVLRPAGMARSGFLRMDELPGDVARGYLSPDPAALRTNVLHLPVLATGDGGAFTTAADMAAFWTALDAGAIVDPATVATMTSLRHPGDRGGPGYGLGFWLRPERGAVELEGHDAGVSFRSTHVPSTGRTTTVISNWSDGAWPLLRLLDELGA